MLPDLGKHALPVLSAYASMIILIIGLVGLSLQNAKKSKETLTRLEEKRSRK
jgi:heme exporter protein D